MNYLPHISSFFRFCFYFITSLLLFFYRIRGCKYTTLRKANEWRNECRRRCCLLYWRARTSCSLMWNKRREKERDFCEDLKKDPMLHKTVYGKLSVSWTFVVRMMRHAYTDRLLMHGGADKLQSRIESNQVRYARQIPSLGSWDQIMIAFFFDIQSSNSDNNRSGAGSIEVVVVVVGRVS